MSAIESLLGPLPGVHAGQPAHEALCALTVNPSTRQVFLWETWPRAALDQVTLGRELRAHAERHRLWQRMLQLPQHDGAAVSASF